MLLYYHFEGNYWRDEEFDDFGRDDFDRAFAVAKQALLETLGRPEQEGQHRIGWLPEPRYQFGIWRLRNGLLILQQGELDLQSGGVDLSACLHPWGPEIPTPDRPLLTDPSAT